LPKKAFLLPCTEKNLKPWLKVKTSVRQVVDDQYNLNARTIVLRREGSLKHTSAVFPAIR